jgi:hypothetical protein
VVKVLRIELELSGSYIEEPQRDCFGENKSHYWGVEMPVYSCDVVEVELHENNLDCYMYGSLSIHLKEAKKKKEHINT